MKKLISIVIIFSVFSAFSQDNMEKYWYYRQRLTDYFVKVGPKVGESIVAERLNDQKLHKYKIGDGTIDLAWYISVLATEYALLKNNNQNTDNTLQELYYAMLAYERLDRCEDKEPWNKSEAKLDGFFNREEILLYTDTSKFSLKGRNKNLNKKDIWGTKKPGQPTYISEIDAYYSYPISKGVAMSQDQAVHLLMGFALIVRSIEDKEITISDLDGKKRNINFYTWAQKLTDLIIEYIKKENWIIKDPNGDNVERGQNAVANSYGFAKAGKYITGKNYQNFVSYNPLESLFWNGQRIPNWVNPYNTTMVMALSAIGDSWQFPMGTANGLWFVGSVWRRHNLYVPLYIYLHNQSATWPSCNKKQIKNMLDSAPKYGTYYWGNTSDKNNQDLMGGWSTLNRFRTEKKEQDDGNENVIANFNGLDFMLLFNLYSLIIDTPNYKHIKPYK